MTTTAEIKKTMEGKMDQSIAAFKNNLTGTAVPACVLIRQEPNQESLMGQDARLIID